jgi:hypothetical protein
MKVSDDGKFEFVRATEVPGEPLAPAVPTGEYVSEVSLGGAAVAAQSMTDPFEMHTIGGTPPSGEVGHHFQRVRSGIIAVDVPRAKLADAERVGVNLFRIKPEGKVIDRMNLDVLRELRKSNRSQRVATITPTDLTQQIRLEAKKALNVKPALITPR